MSISMSWSLSTLICASIISIRVARNVIDIMQIHKELPHPDAFSFSSCNVVVTLVVVVVKATLRRMGPISAE